MEHRGNRLYMTPGEQAAMGLLSGHYNLAMLPGVIDTVHARLTELRAAVPNNQLLVAIDAAGYPPEYADRAARAWTDLHRMPILDRLLTELLEVRFNEPDATQ